jgi:hypothetical protein
MFTKTGRLALATTLLCIGFVAGGRAEAGGIIINTPAGLSPGDTFRIVFVTDGGTLGTSTNISVYNTLVNSDATTQAGGGLVTYNGVTLTFSAIVSTPSIDAITNVGVTGAPIYEANGTPIASTDGTGSGGLWSGSLINAINRDLTRTVVADPWTGTTVSGVGDPGLQLGDASAEIGSTTFANSNWVSVESFPTGIFPGALYGISQVLTVQSSVPEPSTLLMAGTAISAGCAFGWARRRRK